MKPFDLEAAKNGAPIQLRNGTPVTFVAVCEHTNNPANNLIVICNGDLIFRSIDGRFSVSGHTTSERDVVMAPVKKTYWVNVFRAYPRAEPFLTTPVPSKEVADFNIKAWQKNEYIFVKTISFEIEE